MSDSIHDLRRMLHHAHDHMQTMKAVKFLTRGKLPQYTTDHLKHKHKDLYFARCRDAVKIGVSSNPQLRMEDLQTGAPGPLTIIAAIPNAGHLEHTCHQRLSHLHLHGEWFLYTPEVDALIKELS